MEPLVENRKAYFNYEILEKFDAGIVLLGQEVKSIRSGKAQLAGSYVVFRGEELFLIGTHVSPYQPTNTPKEYNPERSRKLLLQKRELQYLLGKSKQKGLTLIPIKLYTIKGKIKLEFGLARGKKKYDKRQKLKERESDREIERTMKGMS